MSYVSREIHTRHAVAPFVLLSIVIINVTAAVVRYSASEMTWIVSSGALNSTFSL